MGVVRIVVDADWNTGRSAQRVSINRVRVRDYSSHCLRSGISSGSFPALQTVLPKEGGERFLESMLEFQAPALSFIKRSFRIAVAAGKMRAAVPLDRGASSVVEQRAQPKKLRLKLLKIPLQQPVGQSAFTRRG